MLGYHGLMQILLPLTLSLATMFTGCGAPDSPYDQGIVTRVIDGDTMNVSLEGQSLTLVVRVLGIDTPETKKPGVEVQCYGPEATEFAKTMLSGERVTLVTDPTQGTVDRWGRTLAYIELEDSADYGEEAIKAGMAKADTKYDVQRQTDYVGLETLARDDRVGLHGACSV